MTSTLQYAGAYLFPPRTKMTSPFYNAHKESLGISPVVKLWMKIPGVLAQYKLNGNRNLIKVDPQGRIEFWNRHNERQQTYAIPDEMRSEILRITPKGKWCVWDSELMNFKTKTIKDMVYLYDVLVYDGCWLLGEDYKTRYQRVLDSVGEKYLTLDNDKNNETLYIAKNLKAEEWASSWAAIKNIPWVEGLVAKRCDYLSRLEMGHEEYNNCGFMCRIRKPHKNYV